MLRHRVCKNTSLENLSPFFTHLVMVFVYLVHVTHVLRGSQSSKFMIMFYHARAADTESKYSRNPAARAKKSPENAVSAFRHESVHRVICELVY